MALYLKLFFFFIISLINFVLSTPRYPAVNQLYVSPHSICRSNFVAEVHEKVFEQTYLFVKHLERRDHIFVQYQFQDSKVSGKCFIKLDKQALIYNLGNLILQTYNYGDSQLVPDKRSEHMAHLIMTIQKQLYPSPILQEESFGFYIQELAKKIKRLPSDQIKTFLAKIPQRYSFYDTHVWQTVYGYLNPILAENIAFPHPWLTDIEPTDHDLEG